MIDPSFDTATVSTYPPTMEDLEKSLSEAADKIVTLEKSVEYHSSLRDKYFMQIRALEDYIKDNHEYIDADVLNELVDIFGFSITKDYEVEITVRFSGTITAPLDYDMDSLENELTAEIAISYYSDLEGDISEDQMEIDYSEA